MFVFSVMLSPYTLTSPSFLLLYYIFALSLTQLFRVDRANPWALTGLFLGQNGWSNEFSERFAPRPAFFSHAQRHCLQKFFRLQLPLIIARYFSINLPLIL